MADQGQAHATSDAASGVEVQGLRAKLVEALAQVRAMPVKDLWDETAKNGGDCRMDSKEAEVVIAILEHALSQRLASVEDLEPEEMCSVNALTRLIVARLAVKR